MGVLVRARYVSGVFIHDRVGVARAVGGRPGAVGHVAQIVGGIQRQGAKAPGVFHAQFHVVGQPHVIMLVEKPAVGGTVRAHAEGNPVQPQFDPPQFVALVARPAGVQEIVAVIPAVLRLAQPAVLLEIQIDPEHIQLEIAAVAAPLRPAGIVFGVIPLHVAGPKRPANLQRSRLDAAESPRARRSQRRQRRHHSPYPVAIRLSSHAESPFGCMAAASPSFPSGNRA